MQKSKMAAMIFHYIANIVKSISISRHHKEQNLFAGLISSILTNFEKINRVCTELLPFKYPIRTPL